MNIIDTLQELYAKKGFICDMDGVIYHGNRLLPGVKEFVDWLYKEEKEFLFLTNSSERSPKEVQQKLARMGLDVDESHFYTSALATAKFLASQSPKCSVYVIGAPGLVNALYDAGITMNDTNPDYVVVGETRAYNYDMILKAVSLLQKGARLVATNSDLTGPTETGIIPACRALVAPIELATGKLCRQAQSSDDAYRSENAWRPFRRSCYDRRSYGHRYSCRNGKRPDYGPGTFRCY